MGRGWMQEYWFCYFPSLDCDFLGASSGKWLVHFQIYIFFILSKNTYNNTNIHQSYRYTYTHVFLYMFISISTYIYICSTHIYLIYPSLHQQKKSINFLGELSLRLDRPRWWVSIVKLDLWGENYQRSLCGHPTRIHQKSKKKTSLKLFWLFFCGEFG